MLWHDRLLQNTKGVGCCVRREKVEKTVQKDGEKALATKSPSLLIRDLGPILKVTNDQKL